MSLPFTSALSAYWTLTWGGSGAAANGHEQELQLNTLVDTPQKYHRSFGGKLEARKKEYQKMVNQYYDLATSFYEYGKNVTVTISALSVLVLLNEQCIGISCREEPGHFFICITLYIMS